VFWKRVPSIRAARIPPETPFPCCPVAQAGLALAGRSVKKGRHDEGCHVSPLEKNVRQEKGKGRDYLCAVNLKAPACRGPLAREKKRAERHALSKGSRHPPRVRPGQPENGKGLPVSRGEECLKGLQSAYAVQNLPSGFKFRAEGQGFGLGRGNEMHGIGGRTKALALDADAVGYNHVKVLAFQLAPGIINHILGFSGKADKIWPGTFSAARVASTSGVEEKARVKPCSRPSFLNLVSP
jgi:hypothetical protein